MTTYNMADSRMDKRSRWARRHRVHYRHRRRAQYNNRDRGAPRSGEKQRRSRRFMVRFFFFALNVLSPSTGTDVTPYVGRFRRRQITPKDTRTAVLAYARFGAPTTVPKRDSACGPKSENVRRMGTANRLDRPRNGTRRSRSSDVGANGLPPDPRMFSHNRPIKIDLSSR